MFLSRNVNIRNFGLAFAVFFLVCAGYYLNVLSKTEGHYIYLIDDAYIHLAMAKNFALHGVWGVTQYKFSSTSSSPLFTFILSVLIKIFGNNDQISLYVNVFFGAGIIFFLNRYYSLFFKNRKDTAIAIIFTLFFTVLHLQLLSGMEHVFHTFLLVLNIFCLYNLDQKKAAALGFYLTLAFMGLVRFESMFYFAALAFVFILIKQWKKAFAVILAGFIPIVIFCYFNYQQSGYFFPNSVVVKGTKLNFDSHLSSQLKIILLDNFLLNPSFYKIGFFPVIMSVIFVINDFKKKSFIESVRDNFLLIVVSLVMICHSMFADLKGAFRYEAYMLAGFSMAMIPKLKGLFDSFKIYLKREKFTSILILMNVILMIYKLGVAHQMLNNGGKNIYEQQIQSARFLHTYYNTSKVVANDIGAITYFTDIHLLDIVGLGSAEMIPFTENKKKIDGEFEDFLAAYGSDNKYDIAIIYDEWFHGYIPKTWKKAAVLKIDDPVMVAKDHVSIYSVDTKNFQLLQQNIRNFNWNKNVKVTIVD